MLIEITNGVYIDTSIISINTIHREGNQEQGRSVIINFGNGTYVRTCLPKPKVLIHHYRFKDMEGWLLCNEDITLTDKQKHDLGKYFADLDDNVMMDCNPKSLENIIGHRYCTMLISMAEKCNKSDFFISGIQAQKDFVAYKNELLEKVKE